MAGAQRFVDAASLASAPRATLATFGRLRAMLSASCAVTALFSTTCWVGFANVIKEGANLPASPGLSTKLAVLGGVTLVKAGLEFGALMRLRGVPNVPLSALPGLERLAQLARVWGVAFGLAFGVLAAHLVYAAAMVVEFVVGFVFALIVTVVTVGSATSKAFSMWWSAFEAMQQPPRWEAQLLDAVFAQPVAGLALSLALTLLFLGPTLCAIYVHARRAAFRPASPQAAQR